MVKQGIMVLVLLLAAGMLLAQQDQGSAGAADGTMENTVSFSEVKGYEIRNTEGTIAGQVTDAVIAPNGDIPWVVIELNEPSSFSGKQYLVPPIAATMDQAEGLGTFEVSEADIADLPMMTNNDPASGEENWDAIAEAYWTNMLGQEIKTDFPRVVLASDLLSYQVKSQDGQDLGRINDIMVDLSQARVAGLAFGENATLGAGQETISADEIGSLVSSITIDQANETITVELNQQQ